MKNLISEITIGNFKFNYCTQIEVQSAWDTFTDTARITMPNRFRKKDGQEIVAGIDNVFKRGDAVTIKVGYFPVLTQVFEGFISKIKPDSPLVFECEDEMWQLKQINLVSKEFTSATIKEVVDYAIASTSLQVVFDDATANIGNLHVDNKGFINAVTLFEVLKKQFGYQIYFIGKVLQVRVLKSFLTLAQPAHRIGLQHNVISDNLDFQRDDDQDMMIRFESKQEDNSVLTFFGSKVDGETVINTTAKTAGLTHSWNIPELSETQIKKIMNDNIDKYIWEGFTGDFTTFTEPMIDKGDRIDLLDNEHPEREGRYLVQSVETRFGINGGRQTVQLRNRVA